MPEERIPWTNEVLDRQTFGSILSLVKGVRAFCCLPPSQALNQPVSGSVLGIAWSITNKEANAMSFLLGNPKLSRRLFLDVPSSGLWECLLYRILPHEEPMWFPRAGGSCTQSSTVCFPWAAAQVLLHLVPVSCCIETSVFKILADAAGLKTPRDMPTHPWWTWEQRWDLNLRMSCTFLVQGLCPRGRCQGKNSWGLVAKPLTALASESPSLSWPYFGNFGSVWVFFFSLCLLFDQL